MPFSVTKVRSVVEITSARYAVDDWNGIGIWVRRNHENMPLTFLTLVLPLLCCLSRLLKKYGALLVHPSADVRFFAVSTVNGVCDSLGYPDNEVFVVPILRPFLRYQPSPGHLTDKEGLESCLHLPWTRERFQGELEKLVAVASSSLSPTRGQWTSISFQVGDGENINKADKKSPAKTIDKKGDAANPEENKIDSQTEEVCAYLKMLARSRTCQMKDVSDGLKVKVQLTQAIEGSLKLAQQIKFPRQDSPGITTTLPSWYKVLRDAQESQGHGSSETAAIRSVSALGQVYGLSIMDQSAPTSNSTLEMTKDHADDILRSDESKKIEAACSGQWGSEVRKTGFMNGFEMPCRSSYFFCRYRLIQH